MINDKVDPFISKYRDDLEHQRDLAFQNLDNSRRNDFTNIMGAANTAGMMYSNFPQRAKKQYDTATYEPNKVKIQSAYQTGLDKLRSNAVNLSNQLKSVNEAIADLNKTSSGDSGDSSDLPGVMTWDYGDGYSIKGMNGGEATYYKDGKQISAGQFLEGTYKNPNWENWNDIWGSGVKTNGVGSDTISAYNGGKADPNSGAYSYLYE